MGYDLCRFTKEVDHEYLCPICLDVMENAVEAPKCQHIFCNDCIKTWLQTHNKCPVDQKPLRYRNLKPITRVLRNLLHKLEIKCQFVSEGCETVIALSGLEYHANHCLYNPDVIVKCDKGCGFQLKRKEYNTHSCVSKLSGLVSVQRKRILFLESLVRDYSRDRRGWRITNGLLFGNRTTIRCKSYCAQLAQHASPLNSHTYFKVKVIDLGNSPEFLRVGLFDSYLLFDERKQIEEKSIINYRSNGSIHIRQENKISSDILGHDWRNDDIIECGIKFGNRVVVYFKHNNRLVSETQVNCSIERFYPTVYTWSMGAKVKPMIHKNMAQQVWLKKRRPNPS